MHSTGARRGRARSSSVSTRRLAQGASGAVDHGQPERHAVTFEKHQRFCVRKGPRHDPDPLAIFPRYPDGKPSRPASYHAIKLHLMPDASEMMKQDGYQCAAQSQASYDWGPSSGVPLDRMRMRAGKPVPR